MPLIKSKSKPALSTNIREMISAGHPRDQAVAAAYATARKAGAKWAHRAEGGPVDGPPPTDMPSDPAVAPIPYIDFPDQSAPPPPPPPPSAPPPKQAMPKPQRPPTGPPTAPPPKGHGSARNPADLVKNLKLFYDHYGELRPDQQKRLMEMLGQPLDQPSAMKPEIDWDEFMKNHDLPGAMRDRPMYHPPYRGAAYGGRMGNALRLARQAGGTDGTDDSDDGPSPATPVESGAMDRSPSQPDASGPTLGPQPERAGIPPEEEHNIRPLYGPRDQREEWGWGPRPHSQHPQQLLQPPTPPSHVFPEPSPFVTPYQPGQGRQGRYLDTARGGAIDHAMRIARQAGGGNPIALPLMGKPGDAAAPAFQGPIHSHVPGRTDKIDLDVAPGSYVVPADVVSSFGEGNSLAGGHLIRFQMGAGADLAGGIKAPQAGPGMLPMQPHAKLHAPLHMKPPGIGHNSQHRHAVGGATYGNNNVLMFRRPHAVGGVTHNNGNVPIVAAGGEVVIPPEHLAHKFGDLDRGHKVWDEIVKQEREAEIKRLKSAPPPKKSNGGAVY